MKIITNPMEVRKELALIEQESAHLSGYTDQDYGYADQDYGFADDDDAGAAGTDKMKKITGGIRQLLDFKFRVTNTGSAPIDRVVALFSPFEFNEASLALAGHTVAGIIRDGQVVPGATVGTNDVVATSSRSGKPISLFMKYAMFNNLRLIGLTITSNQTKSFDTDLQIVKLNPFKQEAEQVIDLANYFSEDNLTGKKIEADLINDGLDFSLDNQTLAKMSILSGTDLTITLRFGGVDNPAAKFDRRARNSTSRIQEQAIARGSKRRF